MNIQEIIDKLNDMSVALLEIKAHAPRYNQMREQIEETRHRLLDHAADIKVFTLRRKSQ